MPWQEQTPGFPQMIPNPSPTWARQELFPSGFSRTHGDDGTHLTGCTQSPGHRHAYRTTTTGDHVQASFFVTHRQIISRRNLRSEVWPTFVPGRLLEPQSLSIENGTNGCRVLLSRSPLIWWRASFRELSNVLSDPDKDDGSPRWPTYDQDWKAIGTTVCDFFLGGGESWAPLLKQLYVLVWAQPSIQK